MSIYQAEIHPLSQAFMSAYPATQYPELMYKRGRPYSCLLIDTHMDYYICIPFRSHIGHTNSFMFKGTRRSQRSRSGLDYSKIVIIKDASYIDPGPAIVDQDEYHEVQRNLARIAAEATAYVDIYVGHMMGSNVLDGRAFARRYQYSTLRYFHEILHIR